MAKKRTKRKTGFPRDSSMTYHAKKEYHRVATKRKKNPGTTIRGWVKAKAVKIVRDKAGRAVSVKIKT